MAKIDTYQGLIERVFWLIRLRWIAVAGVALATFFADKILKISLPVLFLYSIAAVLGIYNLIFLVYSQGIKKKNLTDLPAAMDRIANAQIFLDLLCLTLLIHFSGGIENPLIFYFIFHMIIAGILLTHRAAVLQATFAIFLFSFTVLSEYLEVLPHYCLKGFLPYSLHNNLLYIFGVSFVFISTLYISVYMATSISHKLRERENSLREANILLNEKDRIKSEYVLRVTHDIKEHLSSIQSCIEPVTDGITGSLNEKQKNLLHRAKERAAKLLLFVKALLEITKIKLTKGLELESFSLRELIKAISQDIKARCSSKDITYKIDMAPSIDETRGIRVYIEEAILNLLANSIKYTPRGGEISLSVKDRQHSILLEIKDTGIGIPKDELPHIFDEFYRGRNARQMERDGTGLGLSIAKEIMNPHKGKIWVESEEGKGTTFYLEFPKSN